MARQMSLPSSASQVVPGSQERARRSATFDSPANSAYIPAKVLRRRGESADLVLDPLDRYAMSDRRVGGSRHGAADRRTGRCAASRLRAAVVGSPRARGSQSPGRRAHRTQRRTPARDAAHTARIVGGGTPRRLARHADDARTSVGPADARGLRLRYRLWHGAGVGRAGRRAVHRRDLGRRRHDAPVPRHRRLGRPRQPGAARTAQRAVRPAAVTATGLQEGGANAADSLGEQASDWVMENHGDALAHRVLELCHAAVSEAVTRRHSDAR